MDNPTLPPVVNAAPLSAATHAERYYCRTCRAPLDGPHNWDRVRSHYCFGCEPNGVFVWVIDAHAECRLCTDCGEPFEHVPNSGDKWRCDKCRAQY